jgi:putative tricarboxylic transport membrane protein
MAHHAEQNEHTVSTRAMDLAVAAIFMALAALVMWDSWRLGAAWASDGPGAGYFPFRIGAIMFLASAITFILKLRARALDEERFVDRSQLRMVMQVLIPTIVFVVAIAFLGIYVASAIFIAFFMAWLGRYPAAKIAPVAILVPAALFVMFEIWFLVPLPKGPLETAFGY